MVDRTSSRVNYMSYLKINKIIQKDKKTIMVYYDLNGYKEPIPFYLDILFYKKYEKMDFTDSQKEKLRMIYDFMIEHNSELML